MIYLLTIVAAFIVGLGTVAEQRAAAQAPPEYNLSVKLLVWLVQRRMWLLGVGCSLLGNIVFAWALGSGSVTLVEAVYLVRLLFALAIAALWRRYRVSRRDVFGVLAVTAGLAGFVLAARPEQGAGVQVTNLAWLFSGGSIVVIALVLTAIAVRRGPVLKAILLGAGGGALFGLQASLTHTAVRELAASGPLAFAMTWQGYAVVGTALLGMLLVQSAYEAAPLSASYPGIVTTQMLAGMALGVWLLGGEIERGRVALAAVAAMLLLMIAGIYLLTTSPMLTGQLDQLARRQDVGQARHIETRLQRELRRADRASKRTAARLEAGRNGRPSRRLRRELARIEAGIDRLQRLQEDIRRHRESERQRSQDRSDLAEHDRLQREQEQRIDECACRLRETAEQLVEAWGTGSRDERSG